MSASILPGNETMSRRRREPRGQVTDQKELFFESQKELTSSLIREDGGSLESARCLTHGLVSEFWKISGAGDLPLRASETFGLRFKRVEKAFRGAIAEHAARLARLDPMWSSFEIGRFYMSLLPADFRSANGIFYTPPPLVSRLLTLVRESGVVWEKARVLDPACGGGAFVAPVVGKKIEAGKAGSPGKTLRAIGSSVKGLEIDPFAAWLSQVFADFAAAPLCLAAREPLPLLVEVADALQPRPEEEGTFDLVVGNPPYNRVSPSAAMRSRYSRSLYGHANLYGMFTDQALRLAKTTGMVAFVTPTSFLGGQYFQNLRFVLRSEASPIRLDFVSDRSGVFEDVQQETMLAVYGRNRSSQDVSIGSIDAGREEASCRDLGKFSLPEDLRSPWLLPRTPAQEGAILAARHLSKTLRDYGYGVNTGPLVWNRFKPQMEARAGKNRFPIIWAESVAANGEFAYRAEKRNHAPFFRWEGTHHDWLLIDRPCVLMQRTTSKEQTRRLICAVMPESFIRRHTAVVVENHLNMVRPFVKNPTVSIEAIAAVLGSSVADVLFRCINGSVAVSAYELESLLLPEPEGFAAIDSAIRAGMSHENLDKLIFDLYTKPIHAAAA